jgi:hypothetical protein
MIREIEEEPEPDIFNLNMFEVSWVESVPTLEEIAFELGMEETEEYDERSTKLDFTNVDTKDKLTVPSPWSSRGVLEGEEVREKEVEGALDMISAFVWGIEEVIVELEESEAEVEVENEDEVKEEAEFEFENESGWILVRNIELTESTGLWSATSCPATNPVKLPNKFNKSTEDVSEPSRTWTIATEFNELNTSEDKDS